MKPNFIIRSLSKTIVVLMVVAWSCNGLAWSNADGKITNTTDKVVMNTIYRSCGADAFQVNSGCHNASLIENACAGIGGTARWNNSAFYCRGASANTKSKRAKSQSVRSSFGNTTYQAPQADISLNNNQGAQSYENRLCAKTKYQQGEASIRGEICRYTQGKRSASPIGTFAFRVMEGEPSSGTMACVLRRTEAITKATIAHHSGKKINASKTYNFCNIVGTFILRGNF